MDEAAPWVLGGSGARRLDRGRGRGAAGQRQAPARLLVGGRVDDDARLRHVGNGQAGGPQPQQPRLGVHEVLGGRPGARHVVAGPQLRELRAGRAQPAHEGGPGGLAQVLRERGAEGRHHAGRLLVEVDDAPPHLRLGEAAQQDVAVLAGHGVPLVDEVLVRLVAGQHVVAAVEQQRRQRLQRVEDLPQRRGHGGGRRLRGHGRDAGEAVQVLQLGLVQPQRASDRVQHLHAGADRPALLQPGVPGHPDPGDLGDLLAAEPRGAPAQPGRQAHLGGADARPPGAQERGQLGAATAGGLAVAVAVAVAAGRGRQGARGLVDGGHVLSVRSGRFLVPGGGGTRITGLLVPPSGPAQTHPMTATTSPTIAADADSTERRRWLMLAVLITGQFMALLDVTIVNVAIPTIHARLHASGSALQLVVAGYTVSYAMLLITGARLGDLLGHRNLFLAGLGTFTAASLACGLAPGTGALVTARLVQGAGAAAMVPQILSVIQRQFSGAARTRALGVYTATLASGAVFGQVVGGLLVSANLLGASWRPVFLVNVPVGVVAAGLVPRLVPADHVPGGRPLDLAGLATP